MRIESVNNPQIKEMSRLKTKRHRDRTGLFLIEGLHEIKKAKKAGIVIEKMVICPDFFSDQDERELKQGIPCLECPPSLFRKVAYRESPDGYLAVAKQPSTSLDEIQPSFILVTESLEKPGNLGALLRTADAVGVDAVIVTDLVTDIYNPNVVRSSRGALFSVPVVTTTNQHLIPWLQEKGVKIVATSPGGNQLYTKADLKGKVAIVVGAENVGLSKAWLKAADLLLYLPMKGTVDSLNVALSGGIMLYEALRQRTL